MFLPSYNLDNYSFVASEKIVNERKNDETFFTISIMEVGKGCELEMSTIFRNFSGDVYNRVSGLLLPRHFSIA